MHSGCIGYITAQRQPPGALENTHREREQITGKVVMGSTDSNPPTDVKQASWLSVTLSLAGLPVCLQPAHTEATRRRQHIYFCHVHNRKQNASVILVNPQTLETCFKST